MSRNKIPAKGADGVLREPVAKPVEELLLEPDAAPELVADVPLVEATFQPEARTSHPSRSGIDHYPNDSIHGTRTPDRALRIGRHIRIHKAAIERIEAAVRYRVEGLPLGGNAGAVQGDCHDATAVVLQLLFWSPQVPQAKSPKQKVHSPHGLMSKSKSQLSAAGAEERRLELEVADLEVVVALWCWWWFWRLL